LKPVYVLQESTKPDLTSSQLHVDRKAIVNRKLVCSCAVGVVVLRKSPVDAKTQVLMIQRGNPPATEGLCIPGGRLEGGETLGAGAVREVKEETGIDVKYNPPAAPLQLYGGLANGTPISPRPITTIDGFYYDDAKLEYHYVINEVRTSLSMLAAFGISR
jgi:8-oxo-dGTP pyrophosphatase MutT (NUDIX family)